MNPKKARSRTHCLASDFCRTVQRVPAGHRRYRHRHGAHAACTFHELDPANCHRLLAPPPALAI